VLSIEIDTRSVSEALRQFGERTAPLITAKMLTNAAFKAREALIAEMQSVFDRPTPYTLRSPWVTRAVEGDPNPFAEVFIGNPGGGGVPAWKYIQPMVEGGPRRLKASERQMRQTTVLPAGRFLIATGRADLDAYGNVPGSVMTKILSSINAFTEVGYSANAYGKRGRGVRRNDSYFAIKPGHPGLPPGIYKRTPQGGHVMVFTFGREPQYDPIFDFNGVVRQAVETYAGQVAAAAFREAQGQAS
jgi:hypothetical protein